MKPPKKTAAKKTAAAAKPAPRKSSTVAATKKPVAVKKSAPKPAAKKPAAKVKAPKKVAIPAILLEGDASAPASASGPGQRYALGPGAPIDHPFAGTESGELPEAYGTKRLLLTARDPHWLYAHWDFTAPQLREFNALSKDRHLVLRVYRDTVHGKPASEVHVHPESRNWFLHVGLGGTRYIATLGYYDTAGHWATLSTSKATMTPPDSMSDDTSVRFATIPLEVPFEQLLEMVKTAVPESPTLTEAIQQLRADGGYAILPEPASFASATWTPEQVQSLATIVSMDAVRRVWMGSLEITELLRRKLVHELASAAAAQFSAPSGAGVGGGLSSISSPHGGAAPGAKGFWFNVNAELIIYGATEPDAEVTIGGRVIKLRPDGTFSYRFALPDGQWELPVVAVSSDKTDGRAADLHFSRKTDYLGDVGVHPQDPGLRTPSPENV